MINQQLLTYIRKQKEAGTDDATIKDNLESAGWRSEDIEEGFQAVENNIDGGDTSPQAHQDIREEAAGKRGGPAADDSKQTDDTDPADTATNEDAYKEPIEEEDKPDVAADDNAASVAAGEAKAKSPDEPTGETNTADNVAAQKQTPVSDDDSQQTNPSAASADNADSETDETQSAYPNQPTENVKQEPTNSKPREETVEPIDNNLGPTPLRTFENDKRRSENPNTKPLKSPKEQDGEAQERVDELSEQLADSVSGKKKKSESSVTEADESKAKKQKTPEEAAMEARESRAEEHEENLDSDLSGKGASGEMDAAAVAAAKREQKKKAKKKQTQKKLQQSPQKKRKQKSRQTKDGRQRFSAKKDASTSKNKLSAQRQDRSSRKSSGSNVVSILLFILALVLVGGGAAYAYMTYFQGSEAEITATEVMESLAEAESFDFRITIESASGTTTESMKAIEGVADLSGSTSTQSYYTITTDTTANSPIRAGIAEIENLGTVPDTQRETIRDILLSPEFFSVGEFQTQERLGQTENNDGFVTNRFSVSLDSAQLVSDYATLHQALFNTALSEDVLSNLQSSVSEFEATQGQAWIDTSTGVPYQITFLGTAADGDDVQINFQFKNHGVEPENTPAYNPRSVEQVLREYFASNPIDTGPTVEESTTTPATSTDEEAVDEEADEEAVDEKAEAEREANVRLDKLRINDIQQLSVALEVYANENGSYPQRLDSLTSAETLIARSVPRDPEGGGQYAYSVSEDGERFHLGATLRVISRSQLPGDANLNSRGLGLPGGFNGTSDSCQNVSGTSSTCYDVSGSVE